MGNYGGIDIGGTKIAARIFDANWSTVESREIATPRHSYDAFLDAVNGMIDWLREHDATVGVGLPGVVDADGMLFAANLPVKNRALFADLRRHHSFPIAFINDSHALALAAATVGGGARFERVVGLILGTGVSGGLVIRGKLDPRSGEYGQIPASNWAHELVEQHPITCQCGRVGCYETLISGPGVARWASALCNAKITPETLAEHPNSDVIIQKWAEITAELLATLVLTLGPDCIAIGGGAARVDGLIERLGPALERQLLPGLTTPVITKLDPRENFGLLGAARHGKEVQDHG